MSELHGIGGDARAHLDRLDHLDHLVRLSRLVRLQKTEHQDLPLQMRVRSKANKIL